MNDNGNDYHINTLNSLIEALLKLMPNATINVINKQAPRPLIFIDSGKYLGEPTECGKDSCIHDLKPELSLPLVDDGGPTLEEMGISNNDLDDELDQMIKKMVASGIPTTDIDKPIPEETMKNWRQKTLANNFVKESWRLKQLWMKGIITQEECDKDLGVLRKARDLHSTKLISDEEFQHAIDKHHLLLPNEVPSPEDLSQDED